MGRCRKRLKLNGVPKFWGDWNLWGAGIATDTMMHDPLALLPEELIYEFDFWHEIFVIVQNLVMECLRTRSQIWASFIDIGKIEENNFLLQNHQFFTKGVEIFRKHVFQLYWKACINREMISYREMIRK